MARSLQTLRQYLVGEWLFDNNFNDTSVNSNHGTPTDIEWKPTRRGMKPKTNGSSSHINCGNDTSLDITDEFTLSFWINPSEQSGPFDRILSKLSVGTGFFVWYNNSSQTLLFNINNGNSASDSDKYISGTQIAIKGAWSHVVVKFESGKLYITVNGVEQSEVTAQTSININTGDFDIGRSISHIDSYIDDVKMYNSLLSTDEALLLYNSTLQQNGVQVSEMSRTWDLGDVIDSSGAVVAIATTQESTTDLKDISGNLNNADINGPMPDEGFMRSRRFDESNADNLELNTSIVQSVGTYEFLISPILFTGETNLIEGDVNFKSRMTIDGNTSIETDLNNEFFTFLATSYPLNTISHIIISRDGDVCTLYINGQKHSDVTVIGADQLTTSYIGSQQIATGYTGLIMHSMIKSTPTLESDAINNFNTLAILPLWSISYTDYPNNTTIFTSGDAIPYGSGRVL